MSSRSQERGRPLGFDQAAALDTASIVFWEHGYESTSTPTLEAALGISRSSIANTFGSKHDLFVACLDHYLDLTESELIAPLHGVDVSGLGACAAFFDQLAGLKAERPGCHGCLMVNSMIEFGTSDPDVERRAERYHDSLRTGFDTALRHAAVTESSIPPHAADTLVALAMTINLHARTGNSTAVARTHQSARSLLDSWRQPRPRAVIPDADVRG